MTIELLSNPTSITELEELTGSKQRAVFFITWLKHNRNATKAYLELHPHVKEHTARTLGSRMLTKVDINAILAAYGLGIERYIQILKEGLEAKQMFHGLEVPDWHTRQKFHSTLGRLLGIEKSFEVKTTIQYNQAHFNFSKEIEKSRKARGLTI